MTGLATRRQGWRRGGLCLLLGLAVLLSGCVIIPISLPSPPSVRKVVYKEGSGFARGKVAILDISGPLTASGGAGEGFWDSDSSVVDLDRKLAVAEKDSRIEALILRIDSPGGGVNASDIMYRRILQYKEKTKVPVYVSMQNAAASGGYYISMAGDEIYAHPTSITGSIGVIVILPELWGLMNKIGVDVNAIKTGPNKDAGAFYRQMGPEERAIYQNMVNEMFDRFVGIVAKNRSSLGEDKIRELADGRVYTGEQAEEAGLVDGVAYLDEVISKAKTRVGGDPDVIMITRSSRDRTTSAYARSRIEDTNAVSGKSEAIQINLLNVDLNRALAPSTELFQYLWIP